MDKEIKDLVNKELISVFETLHMTEPGTQEYSNILANAKELITLLNADEQLTLDYLKHSRPDWKFLVEKGVEAATTVGTIVATDAWMRKCLQFETTGSFTSPVTRNMINGLNFRSIKA